MLPLRSNGDEHKDKKVEMIFLLEIQYLLLTWCQYKSTWKGISLSSFWTLWSDEDEHKMKKWYNFRSKCMTYDGYDDNTNWNENSRLLLVLNTCLIALR